MRGSTLSLMLIVVGVICLALGVFYLVPGPAHPFTFSGTPTGSHKTHALVFGVLALFAFIASRFVRSTGRP